MTGKLGALWGKKNYNSGGKKGKVGVSSESFGADRGGDREVRVTVRVK